jgi:uncharacterized protein YndB with AHSA1/START domain
MELLMPSVAAKSPSPSSPSAPGSSSPTRRARGLARRRGRARAEEGGDVHVTFEDGEQRWGTVEEVEPERRLVFSWGDSRVEWTLAPVDGGTRLVVVERSLAPVVGPRMAALSAQASLCLA